MVEDVLGKVDTLFVSHFDLNEVNVLLSDECEVTGLVDWEFSSPLTFGMGFSRIHTLAGDYSEGRFYMLPEFEEAERGFWTELFDGLPEPVALPKHVTYRIPFMRGSDPAYAQETSSA